MNKVIQAKRYTKAALSLAKKMKLTHIDIESKILSERPDLKGSIVQILRDIYQCGYYKSGSSALVLVVVVARDQSQTIELCNLTNIFN